MSNITKYTERCVLCQLTSEDLCAEHSSIEYLIQLKGFNILSEFDRIPLDICALMMDFASSPPLQYIPRLKWLYILRHFKM